jgi:hypothetical protein
VRKGRLPCHRVAAQFGQAVVCNPHVSTKVFAMTRKRATPCGSPIEGVYSNHRAGSAPIVARGRPLSEIDPQFVN